MGYSLVWLAIKNIDPEHARERLGLRITDKKTSFGRTAFSSCQLPAGWFLVVAKSCDSPLIGEKTLAPVSIDCEAVACSVEEHVMYSSAEFWKLGRRIWRVAHDAQRSIRHLQAEGDLPSRYSQILSQARTEQDKEEAGSDDEVDFFFEVPLRLAQDLVGFKHDEESAGVDEDAFTVLESANPAKVRPWWRVWK